MNGYENINDLEKSVSFFSVVDPFNETVHHICSYGSRWLRQELNCIRLPTNYIKLNAVWMLRTLTTSVWWNLWNRWVASRMTIRIYAKTCRRSSWCRGMWVRQFVIKCGACSRHFEDSESVWRIKLKLLKIEIKFRMFLMCMCFI